MKITRKQRIENERIERERIERERIEHARNATWKFTQSQYDDVRAIFDASYTQRVIAKRALCAREHARRENKRNNVSWIFTQQRDDVVYAHIARIKHVAYVERMFTLLHRDEQIIDVGDDYVCVRMNNDDERMYSYVINDEFLITFKQL